MARLRLVALVAGLGLLGSSITVMAVHYLLPIDPLEPDPLINHRVLFAIVFVVICSTLTVTYRVAQRELSS